MNIPVTKPLERLVRKSYSMGKKSGRQITIMACVFRFFDKQIILTRKKGKRARKEVTTGSAL